MQIRQVVFSGTGYRALDIHRWPAGGASFRPKGNGRRYEMGGPEAWWRDLAELDLTNADTVGRFLMRRGDPSGRLEAKLQLTAGDFEGLVRGLRDVAAAWLPTDDDGVSACDPDRIERARISLNDLSFRLPSPFPAPPDHTGRALHLANHLGAELDERAPSGLTIRAKTLAGYLLASASHCLIERVAMRRCRHCASWFDASSRRAGASFCSGSCKTLFYRHSSGDPSTQED